MRKRIKKVPLSQATYDHTKQPGERVSDEIVTIPGQTMSIREMYQRGTQLPENSGNYDEEVDHDDDVKHRTPGYDLSDLDQHKTNIETYKRLVEEKKESEKKEKIKGEIRKEMELEKQKSEEERQAKEEKKPPEKKPPALEDKRIKP